MEFKINSSDLLKALSHIHGIVEVRHTLPILSNIILEAKDNELILSSTNLDIYCADKIKAEVSKEGEISVSAVTFFEIVKRLPSGSEVVMSIEEGENEIILKCGRSKFNLSTLRTDDFPVISDNDLSTNFVLSADELIRVIDKTKFAVSNEETRYYLNGIFLHVPNSDNQKLRAVATDGHRLAQAEIPIPEGASNMPGIILPRKAVGEIRKLTDGTDGIIKVIISNTKAQFVFPNSILTTKLIDGSFPDYQRVIPKENLNKLLVSNQEFSKAIDRVSTVSLEKSRAVKLSLNNNLLSLNVNSHDLGNASEDLEIDYNYDNLEIGFNSKYLLDITSQIQGKEIQILLSDSASPALITDPDQDGVIFVLMPMRVWFSIRFKSQI